MMFFITFGIGKYMDCITITKLKVKKTVLLVF